MAARLILNPRQVVTQAVRKVKVLAVRVKAVAARVSQKMASHNRVTFGGKVVEVSCSEAEESGSESSNSSSESEVEAKKIYPNRKTVETDPNSSQSISLPKFDSKDSEEECRTSHHGFAHCMDVDFGVWRDKKISEGLKQWGEWDKMTCDHAEPGKEVKYPDPLGAPLAYMESHEVFKPIKMSEYDLCHFYQVGLSGDFPEFPTPHEPATNNHMYGFL